MWSPLYRTVQSCGWTAGPLAHAFSPPNPPPFPPPPPCLLLLLVGGYVLTHSHLRGLPAFHYTLNVAEISAFNLGECSLCGLAPPPLLMAVLATNWATARDIYLWLWQSVMSTATKGSRVGMRHLLFFFFFLMSGENVNWIFPIVSSLVIFVFMLCQK